jgi:hypothetical protein
MSVLGQGVCGIPRCTSLALCVWVGVSEIHECVLKCLAMRQDIRGSPCGQTVDRLVDVRYLQYSISVNRHPCQGCKQINQIKSSIQFDLIWIDLDRFDSLDSLTFLPR